MSLLHIGLRAGTSIFLALLITPVGALQATGAETPSGLSPRLAALAHEMDAGNRDALPDFWKEVGGKAPLVEPIPGDARHRRVTFLWRGDEKTASVAVLGGLPGPAMAKPLSRFRDTDLWALTETLPTTARFQYFFLVNVPADPPSNMSEMMRRMRQGQPRPDPLNHHQFEGISVVELPDAPPQPWIRERPNGPHGQLSSRTFKSETLMAEYPLTVYTPPGYAALKGRCGLLVAFDGGFPMMGVTLDNLIAAGKVPPTVVVAVGNLSQETRNRDLGGSEAFANFLARELVPWARKTYRIYPDAAHTTVGGASLGGFMAAYCGLKLSKTFGRVIALSPTLIVAPGQAEPDEVWDGEAPGLLARQYATSARLPVRFYLGVGRYEHSYLVSLLAQARRFHDVLQAKGYPVTYAEFDGGHNSIGWRGAFADAMIALTKS